MNKIFNYIIIDIAIDIIIFILLIGLLTFIKNKFENRSKNIKTEKWLPEEEMKELKQLAYLIFAGILILDLYYLMNINTSYNYLISYVIIDVIVSIIAGAYIFDKNNLKKTIIILITLVPLTGYSLTGLHGVNLELFVILEIIHIIGIIYVIIQIIQDFKVYSKSNKLGYTILILFIIIFSCVFFTKYAENLNLLDSLVYCSNAFTSNGYGLVDATNTEGKIITIILVWSGYILSGVSTALLTIALIHRNYKKKIAIIRNKTAKQEKKIEEINKKLDKLLNDS